MKHHPASFLQTKGVLAMQKNYRRANWMYVPVLLLMFFFIFIPFVRGLQLSLTDWNGFSQQYKYIGLSNFKDLLSDKYVKIALINTLIYGFGSTIFQQILGLSYAVFVNKKFPGRGAMRLFVYLPVLISSLVLGYMMYFLTKTNGGVLNEILGNFGVAPIEWLSNKKLAVTVILAINVLQFCGISMVIYSAGLQNIPEMYYEAARLDGSSSWNTFRKITLPLLYPSIVTSVTLNLIGGLKLFDVIRALTNGGPNYASNSLSTLINSTFFDGQKAGYASSIGILLFVVILIVTIAVQSLFKRGEKIYED